MGAQIAIIGNATIIPAPDTVGIQYAAAQVAASSALVASFYKEYKKETKAIKKGMDFQEEMSDWYHQFMLEHDDPQRLKSICHAMDMSVPVPDPEKLHRKIRAQIRALFAEVNQMPDAMMSGSCLPPDNDCDHRIDAEVERMTAIASHAGISREQDQQLTYLKKRQQAVLNGLRMANRAPSAAFNEVANYLNVRQGLASMASGGFNGALGTMGVGLGRLAEGVSAREAKLKAEAES